MDFKIGDRIESLIDGFITKELEGNNVNILLYGKEAKGTVINVWKDDLLVNFDNGHGDGNWSIPKRKAKFVTKEKEMNFVEEVKETYKNNLKEKWNKFVNENILINCESKLNFEDFMNFACKNFDLDYLIYKDCFEEVGNELCFNFINNDLFYDDREYYIDEKKYDNYKILTWNEFIKNNEVDKMEKTFKEVIRDIKKGEVWESEYRIIYIDVDQIRIDNKNGREFNFMIFNDMDKYTLQKKNMIILKLIQLI